ncbi:MAG: hypothetical protein WBK91_10340 [Alphaproteobacteria bacterium]
MMRALTRIFLSSRGGGFVPGSWGRQGRRFAMFGVLVLALLVARPQPAHAICCLPGCPEGCEVSTLPCTIIDANILMAQLTAVIVGLIQAGNLAIVDAVAGMAASIQAQWEKSSMMTRELWMAHLKHQTTVDMDLTIKEMTVATRLNEFDGTCMLNLTASNAIITAPHARVLPETLQRGSSALALNQLYDTQRMRLSALQRYCKNGMLRRPPGPAGTTAFDQMGCFEDPVFTDAYLQSGRVLDHLVLVPPSYAVRGTYPDGKPVTDMSILDNPDDPANPIPAQVVWNRLTDKQKNYVAALRYCQHLEQSRLQSTSFNSEQASTPDNMRRITRNLSSIGLLQTLSYACYKELARRTAPNVYDTADPAMSTPAMIQKRNDDFKVVKQLQQAVADSRVWQAFTGYDLVQGTPINPVPGQVFISPALYQQAQYFSFCTNRETQYSLDVGSGRPAEIHNNRMMCQSIIENKQNIDWRYAHLFSMVDKGLKAVGEGFLPPVATPTRAEHDAAGVRRVNMRPGASAAAPLPLGQLIRKLDQKNSGVAAVKAPQ